MVMELIGTEISMMVSHAALRADATVSTDAPDSFQYLHTS